MNDPRTDPDAEDRRLAAGRAEVAAAWSELVAGVVDPCASARDLIRGSPWWAVGLGLAAGVAAGLASGAPEARDASAPRSAPAPAPAPAFQPTPRPPTLAAQLCGALASLALAAFTAPARRTSASQPAARNETAPDDDLLRPHPPRS